MLLILSKPTYLLISGNCTNEYDDVTLFSDAAKAAIKKALDTGSKVISTFFFYFQEFRPNFYRPSTMPICKICTSRSIEIVPRGGPPLKMGGPPLEFNNIRPQIGGPPQKFINIQPPKMGFAFRIHQHIAPK